MRQGFAPHPSAPVMVIAGIAAGCLVLAAGRSDAAAQLPPFQLAADLLVGASFLIAAAAMRAPGLTRFLAAGVGAFWLMGSVVPALSAAHRTALACCLLVFAADPPSGWVRRGVAVVSLALVVPLESQGVSAGVFVAVAAVRFVGSGRWTPNEWADLRSTWATAAWSAIAVAAVFGMGGVAAAVGAQSLDAQLVLVGYEGVLLAVAVALIASTRLRPPVSELSDVLLDSTEVGTSGLTTLLRDLLRDPDVKIVAADGTTFPDSETKNVRLERVQVLDGGRHVADLIHRTGSIPDSETLEAILVAVRLSVVHEEVSAELERNQADLLAASARLEQAGEKRRAVLRERLRAEVLGPVADARSTLDRVRDQVALTGAVSALSIAARELRGAESDIRGVAEGMPPLGPGTLHTALCRLGDRDPRVTVDADPNASGDEESEAMLRYVASELLTNALKHADAGVIRIVLRRDGAGLTLAVEDDGVGGAQATGGGLTGVADRVNGCGGRLEVRSPPAGGTTVTVTVAVPVRTPSSTA